MMSYDDSPIMVDVYAMMIRKDRCKLAARNAQQQVRFLTVSFFGLLMSAGTNEINELYPRLLRRAQVTKGSGRPAGDLEGRPGWGEHAPSLWQ